MKVAPSFASLCLKHKGLRELPNACNSAKHAGHQGAGLAKRGDNAGMNYAALIKEVGRGAKGARSLDQATAHALFGAMLDGQIPDMELGAILIALRIKSEDLPELLGFKAALDERTPALVAPGGIRTVCIPSLNGARRQPNLMPYLALRLQQLGVPVVIHGHFDFDSRSDPFALLAALGITAQASVESARMQLATQQLTCLRTETLLPGLQRLLALRARLGVRNSAHSMVKLLDPARGHSVRLVSVTHPEYLQRMEEFLCADGGHALLLRGTEGEAFANPRRRPRLLGFANGQACEMFAAEEGGAPPLENMPETAALPENVVVVQGMLAGTRAVPQPVLDQLAACLVLAGRANDLAQASNIVRPTR